MSPAFLFRLCTAEIVGTGPEAWIRRIGQASLARRRFFESYAQSGATASKRFFARRRPPANDLAEPDAPTLEPHHGHALTRRVLSAAAYAALLPLALFCLAFMLSLRYDPR